MAYFNGYPATYQPMMQAPQFQAQPQNQQGGLIWVQGEAAAKSYMVAPGNTVQLWDSEEKVIYLKSADPSGMPSMKILDYTIRGEEAAKDAPEYVTKADFDALAEKVKELSKRRKVVREVEDDE
jgi:hypothetical protein